MTSRPLVVLLAGRSGVGKSTFAPYLAHSLGGFVFDSDNLFDTPRRAVGEASGLDAPDLHQLLEAAGIAAEARASMTDRSCIEISMHGIESVERLVAMVGTNLLLSAVRAPTQTEAASDG